VRFARTGTIAGTLAATQRDFSRHAAKEGADALFVSLEADNAECRNAYARLLSCACRLASACLGTLPLTRPLELKSDDFQTGLRRRVGIHVLPLDALHVQCECFDILTGILRRSVH
jgi:hypothetical protein